MIVHLSLGKGYLQAGHSHPENESLGLVLTGKVRMSVSGTETILLPGDSWHHPLGEHHVTEALEDSEAIEVHVPRRHDLMQRFGLE